jgi:hypothetical protein
MKSGISLRKNGNDYLQFCRAGKVLPLGKPVVFVAARFSINAIDFQLAHFYFRPMHVEIIQCPQHGTIFKRQDGLRFAFDAYVTIIFNESYKLMLKIKTSMGHLAFPIPDDDTLKCFLQVVERGKFTKRPSTYEYVEAKLVKGSIEYDAYLPWEGVA